MITLRTLTGSLSLVALLGGCVTVSERRMPPTGDEWSNTDSSTETQEDRLIAEIEDDEENARLWFLIGDLYENQGRYAEAAIAFMRMKELIEEQNPKAHFTAGDYHLGRVFALLKDYTRALSHLSAVLKEQPKDTSAASLNKHFRESHYLLAVIYYNSKQYEDALEHARAFKAIGGEELRGDSLIMSVRHARSENRSRGG